MNCCAESRLEIKSPEDILFIKAEAQLGYSNLPAEKIFMAFKRFSYYGNQSQSQLEMTLKVLGLNFEEGAYYYKQTRIKQNFNLKTLIIWGIALSELATPKEKAQFFFLCQDTQCTGTMTYTQAKELIAILEHLFIEIIPKYCMQQFPDESDEGKISQLQSS